MSDHGGDGPDGRPASLAVKLMAIAGEYELDRKRERAFLEKRLAAAAEANAALERAAREHAKTVEALTARAERAEA